MIGMLLGDFLPWIVGAFGALAGVFLYGRGQRKAGARESELKRRLNDGREALDTERKLNANDRDGDALERLRARGKLRD